MTSGDGPDGPGGQRLDQWLCYARITKSRTLAQALIERGKVRINTSRVDKASHRLKPGDAITIALGPRVRILKVLGMGGRRGPASEAAGLYEELTPRADGTTCSTVAGGPIAPSAAHAPASAVRLPGSGRPTKRERRDTNRLKSWD
jgi:ribosome-associated heat shock protein Hsp15